MSIEALREQFPDFARDIKLNLSTVLTEEGAADLTLKQIYGAALSAAYATKNPTLINAITSDAKQHLQTEDINAAKAAAAIMAMNNIYYRFIHLAADKEYSALPAKLRMNIIGKPGIAKVDFELFCLAVSIINGCGMCVEAHAQEIVKHGLTKLAVQSVARIAAVINSAAMALELAE